MECAAWPPRSHGVVTNIKARLGRERHGLTVDLDNPRHAGHLDDRSVRGHAWRQGMKAALRPDRTRVAAGISQDRLNLFDGARRHELRWRGGDAAIVIPNHVFHLTLPNEHP